MPKVLPTGMFVSVKFKYAPHKAGVPLEFRLLPRRRSLIGCHGNEKARKSICVASATVRASKKQFPVQGSVGNLKHHDNIFITKTSLTLDKKFSLALWLVAVL